MPRGTAIGVFLFAGVIAAGCLRAVPVQPPPSEGIADLDTYLYTEDGDEANGLFATLAVHPVSELEAALRAPRRYPPSPTGLLPGRQIRVGEHVRRYGLYVPESYNSAKAYPLVVCQHGAGFDGDGYLERWRPRLGEDYILVCPTVELGAWWTPGAEAFVLTLIDQIMRDYHVDPDRVYLTGMSNGAIGTYLIGLNHPDRFAALVPMAGALPGPLLALLDNARSTPIYIIHGSKDQVMPVRYSREVWAYLLERGYSVQYREHDRVHPLAGGHFFPREELPPLVKWLSGRKRPHWPRTVTIVRDRDHPRRAWWLRIDEVGPGVGSFWASEVDPEETRRLKEGAYARLEAVAGEGNTIDVTSENIRRYTVFLSPMLVDFDRPVIIRTNGKLSFEGRVEPEAGVLLEEARWWPDPENLVEAALEIVVEP